MKQAVTVALLFWLSVAGALSCARKESEGERGKPGSETEAPREVPDIPIDVMPKVLHASVDYPEEARARGEEGIVYVKALVGKDGKVTQGMIDPKQPASALLGKAAVDAVTQWTFEPARAKGEPVAVWIVVPVSFKLK